MRTIAIDHNSSLTGIDTLGRAVGQAVDKEHGVTGFEMDFDGALQSVQRSRTAVGIQVYGVDQV